MTAKPDWELPALARDAAETTQESAYLRLRNAIMVGAIPPGTALTMRGLAARLDLSPTPIREAIRRLSSERAVEILGNRRILVPTMQSGRFEELIQLRITLETHAARRALPYISDIIIARLKDIDDAMDTSITGDNFDQLTLLNHDFHRALYAANPFQTVTPLLESIWLQLGPFQRQVVEGVQNYYVVDRHKEVLQALRDRDDLSLSIAIEADIRDGIGRAGREALLKARRSDGQEPN